MGSTWYQTKNDLSFSLMLLLVFSGRIVGGGEDPPVGCDSKERDALNALKAEFNHPFLNDNWIGLECNVNHPPVWHGIEWLNDRVTGISLEGIGLTGTIHDLALMNLTELTYLSFKSNWISGNIMDFSFTKKLTYIDLSYNKFDGSIPDSLLDLNVLESLKLQQNQLTGLIPGFSQSSLKEFNVSNNNLSGEIPGTSTLQFFGFSSYFGNPSLCGSPLPISCETTNKRRIKLLAGSSLFTLLVVLDVIVLAVVVLLSVVYFRKKMRKGRDLDRKKKNKKVDIEAVQDHEDRGMKLKFMDEGGATFEIRDLLKASAEGLGKGNYGKSFKAMLDNGPAVVVKRLTDLRPLSSEEFATQMTLLAEQKHKNLLPLLAYCYSPDEKLLVYKFAEKGNLFNRIHGGRGKNRILFKWSSRLSVAKDVARAMEYLHLNTKSQTTIPHGNLKSSNILLDENEVALVCDYGLTSLISLPVASQRMISFKSPEYQNRKKISRKSDVWSYGCLLLELLTGRMFMHTAPQGSLNGVDLCNWVNRAVREEWTCEIFDTEIFSRKRKDIEEMVRLLQIALKCCDDSPEKWPEMEEVVREVEDITRNDSEENGDFSSGRSSNDVSSVSTSNRSYG